MLKHYMYKGLQWQFNEGEQPDGAVEVKAAKPSDKAIEPSDKVAKPQNKSRKVAKK